MELCHLWQEKRIPEDLVTEAIRNDEMGHFWYHWFNFQNKLQGLGDFRATIWIGVDLLLQPQNGEWELSIIIRGNESKPKAKKPATLQNSVSVQPHTPQAESVRIRP